MVVVARVLAGLQAVFYAVVWFGIVDLLTPFVQDEAEWRSGFLLETGWGLLFLVLVAMPFGVLAVRPGHPGALAGLTITAVALVTGGLWAREIPQVLNGLALGAGVAVVGGLGGWRAPQRRALDPLLALLSGVGLAGALVLGWDTLEHAVMLDDVTNGVDHSGVQASLGLAVAASVALAAVTAARLPAWSAAACAVWLAGVSLAYPDIEGSLGTPGAVGALVWSALVAVRLLRSRG
ncbi:MAG TPA: hypothetical protein VD864_15105 [Nocardioides sp.]|nr:hypothetical protein [Nocardioides sp.]